MEDITVNIFYGKEGQMLGIIGTRIRYFIRRRKKLPPEDLDEIAYRREVNAKRMVKLAKRGRIRIQRGGEIKKEEEDA